MGKPGDEVSTESGSDRVLPPYHWVGWGAENPVATALGTDTHL